MVAIIHIGVGSDVVCSFGLGNAKALVRGTDSRRFHAFLCPFVKCMIKWHNKMEKVFTTYFTFFTAVLSFTISRN